MARLTLVALVVAACVSTVVHGEVSKAEYTGYGDWAGAIHEYANPFAGGVTFGLAENWSGGQSLSGLLYRRSVAARLVKDGAAAQESAWFTAQAAAAFPVGTVITGQQVWNGFGTDMPFELTLGNSRGGAVNWGDFDVVLTGPGTLAWETLRVVTLDEVGTYDAFRLSVQSTPYGSAGFVDFNEVLLLSDRLSLLTGVTATASVGDDIANDLLRLDKTGAGWWGGNTDVRVTFDLGGKQTVDAIVFWSFANHPVEFKVLCLGDEGQEVDVAFITMFTDPGDQPSGGWTLPLQFGKAIETGTIILELTDLGNVNGMAGLREVMFFTNVPEPATMALLAIGGLALLRRRK